MSDEAKCCSGFDPRFTSYDSFPEIQTSFTVLLVYDSLSFLCVVTVVVV